MGKSKKAAIVIAGIELMHRIREAQSSLANLDLEDATAPAVWNTVLAA